MGFAAATAYLQGTIDERRSPHDLARLDRMALLLKELGDPHLAYPTIHVGGTSGKGSTASMLATILQARGLRCGLHIKPQLYSITERMQVNRRPIYEDRFAALYGLIRPALDDVAARLSRPTYFETLLALAFVHFLEEKVDIAVIEVGLGGTLDGTNLVQPLVSIITNVGLDHREILGDTVEEIARDKAGIAKNTTPLISAAQGSARRVIESVCREVGAPFYAVSDIATVESLRETAQGQHFTVTTPTDQYDIGMNVLGHFQQVNAATAIVALEHLPSTLSPEKRDIEAGFAGLRLPGRMEYVQAHPGVLFDVAHNPDKIESLVTSMLKLFPDRRIHAVVAISETKDVEPMLVSLAKLQASYIFTRFAASGRSAVRPDRLASYLRGMGAWVRVIEDPIEAFGVARRSAGTHDLVLVTGSTFVVGEIRHWWSTNMSATLT